MQTRLKGRPWTKTEVDKLVLMAGQFKSLDEIAIELGRSRPSVFNKLREMRRADRDGLCGLDRMRRQIEGELADRADALLADAILEEMSRRHGVPPAVAFDAMAVALAALFPDRYTGPVVKPALPGRPSDPERGGLVSLVRRVRMKQ